MMLPTDIRKRVSKIELKTMIESRSKPFETLKISNIIYTEIFNDTVLSGVEFEDIIFSNCYFENVKFANSKFTRVNFIDCEMPDSDFRSVQLNGCNIEHCTIKNSNFAGSNFTCVDIKYTDMSLTNFKKSYFKFVIWSNCNLEGSNFNSVEGDKLKFESSNLNKISFQNSKFNDHPHIFKCNLHSTDFSRSKGLLNPIDYLSENFEWNNDGMIVYKIFDHFMPTVWSDNKKPGDVLREELNYDRTMDFGCGINAANQQWFQDRKQEGAFDGVPDFCQDVWKCLIKFQWLSGVLVPYNVYGQIRCCRIQLIKKFNQTELYNFYYYNKGV